VAQPLLAAYQLGHTSIAAGTLDAPTGLRTALYIFTDSHGDYYEFTDGLPRYPGSAEHHEHA
jgi:hypothetical protein